jgi:NAD(P)H-hydrate epimerase
VILTPHPGEFRRLAAAVGIEADPIDPRGRSEAAAALAGRLGCIVVLKGAGTVVSDGLRTWVNQTGNAALATAGTGDVLTGVIAGLVAQFHREAVPRGAAAGGLSLFDCARLGTRLHGLAADRWAGRHGTAGLLVRDLLDELPDAMQQMRSDDRTP